MAMLVAASSRLQLPRPRPRPRPRSGWLAQRAARRVRTQQSRQQAQTHCKVQRQRCDSHARAALVHPSAVRRHLPAQMRRMQSATSSTRLAQQLLLRQQSQCQQSTFMRCWGLPAKIPLLPFCGAMAQSIPATKTSSKLKRWHCMQGKIMQYGSLNSCARPMLVRKAAK